MRTCAAITLAITATVLAGTSARAEEPAQMAAAELRSWPDEPDGWRRSLAPLAHVRFCMQYADQCLREAAPATPPALSAERRRELARIDAAVNRAIRPNASADGGSGDVWTIGPRAGDCDDYAVTKRARLIAGGWPASALLLTQVEADGRPHLVLTVRGRDGDLILDNLAPAPRPAEAARYRVVRIQSATDPGLWYAPAERVRRRYAAR